MEIEMLWSGVLTVAIGACAWIVKSIYNEQHRLQVLLNRTREELAKEYVTKAEVHTDINRVISRLESLDSKIDRLMERVSRP